jgi:DNA invertase Pin-like site-specific DNA recombinase
MKPIIGYRRVSTDKQGKSGLGLEAQQFAIERYANQEGGTILKIYTETESGRRSDRPQLQNALAHARRSKALIVVAKLDRLSRNVAFLSALMESQVDFVCCDNPHANKLTIHLLSCIAEFEAGLISQRTKDALAALKARGVKLGSRRPGAPQLSYQSMKRGAVAAGRKQREAARAAYVDLRPQMVSWRESSTLQEIANRLNAEGHRTRRGKMFSAAQVKRILEISK